MHAILGEVFPRPHQAVLAALEAVGPQIRTPSDPWRADRSLGWVEVQFRLAGDLIADQPLYGKSKFIGERLGVGGPGRVTRVDAARQIRNLPVGKTIVSGMQDIPQVTLQIFPFRPKR